MKASDDRPWQQFEGLVKRILETNGYNVSIHSPRGNYGFDFLAEYGGENWAVEVKFYRTARAQPTLIEEAANRVINNGIAAHAQKGMLIMSCILLPEMRLSLEQRFQIVFVDRIDLQIMAAKEPSLADELDALLESRSEEILRRPYQRIDPKESDAVLPRFAPRPSQTRGHELCEKLKKIVRGREGWREYEDACAEIIRYLFPNDLEGWHEQEGTDDGLNRYDLVCRIRPTTEFWRFLIDHLDSRYVVFEFKNYADEINQSQILTTEKYLLERGLRRVAIIMARAGADANAVRMTKGAMREHGKLILIIDDEKTCRMLHMRDRGDDPTDLLFEVADDFLLKLAR